MLSAQLQLNLSLTSALEHCVFKNNFVIVSKLFWGRERNKHRAPRTQSLEIQLQDKKDSVSSRRTTQQAKQVMHFLSRDNDLHPQTGTGTRLELQTVKLRLADLRPGMFVSKLDRSWLGTPFPLQGFSIRDEQDIHRLQKYCQHVYVDQYSYEQYQHSPLVQPAPPQPTTTHNQPSPTTSTGKANGKAKHFIQTHLNATGPASFSQVRAVWGESRQLAYSLNERIAQGHDIDRNQVEQAARNLTRAVLKRNSSMLWLSRIKAHDQYTAEHCISVGILAASFGQYLGVREAEIEVLSLAGMMHDVGKLRLPSSLLNKPGRLDEAELQKMKAHARIGYQLLLNDHGLPEMVLEAALSHHERLDGTGYPFGKSGDQISRIARIISIVDAYDAMTSERPYAEARTHQEALRELHRNAGTQFDTLLARAFIRMMGIYPPGTLVKLSDSTLAAVLEHRHQDPHRPIVVRVRSADGLPVSPQIIDLADQDFLNIKAELREADTTLDLRRFSEENLPNIMRQLH